MLLEISRRALRAPFRRVVCHGPYLLLLLLLFVAPPAAARQAGRIDVTVVSGSGDVVPGAEVRLDGTGLRAVTGPDGRAALDPVAPGEHTIVVHRIGYREARLDVHVVPGRTVTLRITLADEPIPLGALEVAVLRPDLNPVAELDERSVAEANAHDAGSLLRSLPGLDAVRRGALGLDPVVRGLRETQVGVYVDGVHSFPGGPGGMDSPLSHVDPSAIKSLEIIKGPYALTWGAGNMSAIRVETLPLPGEGAAPLGARIFTGYDSNLDGAEVGAEAAGAVGRVRYAAAGAWRRADDYTAGNDVEVPASFRTGEGRVKLGVRTSPNSLLTLSGAYQAQRDIDYPGRPMNAEYFDVYNGSARWTLTRDHGTLQGLDALIYAYDVDHLMDNDGKPTAEPDPNRMPPFPLDIAARSGIRVYGGRLAARLEAGRNTRIEVGGDVYHATHDAHRQRNRRDTGDALGTDLIWGGARILDAGLFARAEHSIAGVDLSAAVRLDRVHADADSASEFFRTQVSDDLESKETNLSAAVTVAIPLSSHWSISTGLGSVVRTADANERFSDRNASRKMQIGADFVGDPALKPERSTQLDLWLEGRYPRVALSLNLFGRRIDDHITIEPTDLPPRGAMSAPTVYRYVNGDAVYWGYEATAALRLPHAFTLSGTLSYLYGKDETLDEPAFGVPPLRGDVHLRWEPEYRGAFLEVAWRGVDRQDRVASTRGEVPTPGYGTLALQGGLDLSRHIRIRAGVNNLTNAEIVNHLNGTNPFTGARLPEPGRVFFVRADYRL